MNKSAGRHEGFASIEEIVLEARNGKMFVLVDNEDRENEGCLLYTSPSPRDGLLSRMPSSA